MCGGIVGALNSGMSQSAQQSSWAKITYNITYNSGRIVSYTIAGAIAGFIGAQSARIPIETVLPIGGLIAGTFMIALGLYLAGWWPSFAWIERGGGLLWRYIQPLSKRFLPVKSPLHAFGLGLVWGWLPCGLVYSALALALISASPTLGAMLMLSFGLGTLPMLMMMGKAFEYLQDIARSQTWRRVAGVVVVLFGIYTISATNSGHRHMHTPTGVAGFGEQAIEQLQTAVSLLYDRCLNLVQ